MPHSWVVDLVVDEEIDWHWCDSCIQQKCFCSCIWLRKFFKKKGVRNEHFGVCHELQFIFTHTCHTFSTQTFRFLIRLSTINVIFLCHCPGLSCFLLFLPRLHQSRFRLYLRKILVHAIGDHIMWSE